MPKVTVCTYCARKIDQDKEEFTLIPGSKDSYAHLECYTKNNAPGRPSQSTPLYRV